MVVKSAGERAATAVATAAERQEAVTQADELAAVGTGKAAMVAGEGTSAGQTVLPVGRVAAALTAAAERGAVERAVDWVVGAMAVATGVERAAGTEEAMEAAETVVEEMEGAREAVARAAAPARASWAGWLAATA